MNKLNKYGVLEVVPWRRGSGSSTTQDYNDLENKPKLNGTELVGDIQITIPTALSQLSGDSTHRIVTDTEKATWNAKGSTILVSGSAVTSLVAGTNVTLNNVDGAVTITCTGGGTGTTDYTVLSNKPKINNVELSGNKTLSDLGITTTACKPFPTGTNFYGTTLELCESLFATGEDKTGCIFMNTVWLTDTPLGGQADLMLTVINKPTSGTSDGTVYLLNLHSTNTKERSWTTMYFRDAGDVSGNMEYGTTDCPWFANPMGVMDGYDSKTKVGDILDKTYRAATEKYVDDATSSTKSYVDTSVATAKLKNAYTSIRQVRDYLFETEFPVKKRDYTAAATYYAQTLADGEEPIGPGGCSGIFAAPYTMRNLDWTYDYGVDFIVHVEKDEEEGTYRSISMCGCLPYFTRDHVESGDYDERYYLVPFATVDGVNEKGVYIQTNVVPKKASTINVAHTCEESQYKGKLAVNMIPRVILDYCSTATETAIREVLGRYDIFRSPKFKSEYDCHFLIADMPEDTTSEFHSCILEFKSDGTGYNILFAENAKQLITNFSCDAGIGEEFALDWDAINANCPYGSGLERWELMRTELFASTSLEQIAKDLYYSKAYKTDTSPVWYTEFTSEDDDLTVIKARDDQAAYSTVLAAERAKYVARTRSDSDPVWQTVHSVIYDLSKKSLKITIQERSDDVITCYLVPDVYDEQAAEEALETKQSSTDNALSTTQKTIVGAINELKYEVDQLNAAENDLQNI